MELIKPNPRTPEQWAEHASIQHGWVHAYSIAKKYDTEFLGKDSGVKNPHKAYWNKVVKTLEACAPAGGIEAYNETKSQTKGEKQ